MTQALPIAAPTRHGYVLVQGRGVHRCPPPIVNGRLRVSGRWAMACFVPAYRRARLAWGTNGSAIVEEILAELQPDMRVAAPTTGPERELRRRVELSVAVLLNAAGVPTPYPADPKTPRPVDLPPGPPWYRSLVTGWLQ